MLAATTKPETTTHSITAPKYKHNQPSKSTAEHKVPRSALHHCNGQSLITTGNPKLRQKDYPLQPKQEIRSDLYAGVEKKTDTLPTRTNEPMQTCPTNTRIHQHPPTRYPSPTAANPTDYPSTTAPRQSCSRELKQTIESKGQKP